MDDGNVMILNINEPLFAIQGNFNWPKKPVLEDSVMSGFSYNDVQITLYDMIVKDTGCAGRFCDKNRIFRDGKVLGKCACFQHVSRGARVVAALSIDLKLSDGTSFFVQDYCSQWFVDTYLLTSALHQSYRENNFNKNGGRDAFLTSAIEVIDYITNHGGWRILGWAKRGMVDDPNAQQQDRGFNQERQMIRAGNLKRHIARIEPMHPERIDIQHLEGLKFNPTSLLDDLND